jgi:hypothetical protein
MNMNQHLKALAFRHSELDRLIANENRRPLPNFSALKELKNRKLKIKEQMLGMHRV